MNNPANPRPTSLVALAIFLLLVIACGQSAQAVPPTRAAPSPDPATRRSDASEQTGASNVVVIRNQGGRWKDTRPEVSRGWALGCLPGIT